MFESVNPATAEVVARHPVYAPRQTEARLSAADLAARQWGRTRVSERVALLLRIAELRERDREEHALLMTRDGKTRGAGAN